MSYHIVLYLESIHFKEEGVYKCCKEGEEGEGSPTIPSTSIVWLPQIMPKIPSKIQENLPLFWALVEGTILIPIEVQSPPLEFTMWKNVHDMSVLCLYHCAPPLASHHCPLPMPLNICWLLFCCCCCQHCPCPSTTDRSCLPVAMPSWLFHPPCLFSCICPPPHPTIVAYPLLWICWLMFATGDGSAIVVPLSL